MNFNMKCDKCKKEFPENEIDVSHDIPKYMGGTDSDGRHILCKECHDKYDYEILKIGLMNYIKLLSPIDKVIFRKAAKLVKGYFFKKEDDIKTTPK